MIDTHWEQQDAVQATGKSPVRERGVGIVPAILRSVDIRYRLIISFIVISLIPLLIFSVIFYAESSAAIRKKTGILEAEIVRQVVQNMQDVLAKDTTGPTAGLPDNVHAAQARFSGIFDDVIGDDDASVFVLDVNNGRIMVHPDDAPSDAARLNIRPPFADPALMSSIGRIVGSGGGPNFVSYAGSDNQEYLAAFASVPDTTWAVVSMMPQHALVAEVHSLRNRVISIGAICTVIVLLLSYVICRSISEPLGRLVGTMKQTETGNYLLRMRCDGNDEIALLSHKFNEMAGKMHQHNAQLDALVAARTRDLAEANVMLEALSATDVLTGLANRRRLDTVLLSELRRAIRSAKHLAVIMLDVDFFKKYNDHYGHPAGDECLREVARALQDGCHRGGDLVARYGGEEFVLIAADTDMAGALVLAETMRSAIEALDLPHVDSAFGHVTISVGVAAIRPHADHTTDLLLRVADRAMYRAKLLGRNRVEVMNDDSI